MSELLDLDAPKYLQAASSSSNGRLLEHVDLTRLLLAGAATGEHRAEMGQFLTPAPVARFMAGLLDAAAPCVRLLDAGVGVGALSAAVVAELCARTESARALSVTAYELDADFLGHLDETLEACRLACDAAGIVFRPLRRSMSWSLSLWTSMVLIPIFGLRHDPHAP